MISDRTDRYAFIHYGGDSPYDDAFTHWGETGRLDPFTTVELDEIRSVAAMHLNTPAWEGTVSLIMFEDAVARELTRRAQRGI
jgi:hypothetical protein